MPSSNVRRGLYWSETTHTWHYEFRLKVPGAEKSEKFNGDTGQVIEADARIWLAAFKKRLHDEAVGLQPQAGQPSPALRRGLALWLAAHEACSEGHQANVRRAVEIHAKHLLDTPMDQIREEDLELLRVRYLKETGHGFQGAELPHSEAGANKAVHHVRLVLTWCGQRGHAPAVAPKIKPLNAQGKVKAVVWPEQVQAFLAEADRGGYDHAAIGPRMIPHSATAIRMMLGLGLREEEALWARWEWLDTRRQVYVAGKTKGGRVREVPIPSWLAEHLEGLRALQKGPKKGLILPAGLDDDDQQVPHDRLFTTKPVARVAAVLKIVGLTPHRLRATFATAHWELGTPLSQIQQMMGHKRPETTMKYIVARPKDQAEAQEKVAKAMGFTSYPPTVPERPATFTIKRVLRVKAN